jgi:hypothetical protein
MRATPRTDKTAKVPLDVDPNAELLDWTGKEIEAGIATCQGLIAGQTLFFDAVSDLTRHMIILYDVLSGEQRETAEALVSSIFARERVQRFSVATFGADAVAIGVIDTQRRSEVRIARLRGKPPKMRVGPWMVMANARVGLDLLPPAAAGNLLH